MTATKKHHFDWIRTDSRERSYQLRDGRSKVISLTWQNIRGTCATAEARSERCIYTCIGYLSKQVIVQSAVTGMTLAIFKPGAGGGVLRFLDGRSYILKSAHLMRPEMQWQDERGCTLVRFNGAVGFDTKSGEVDLTDEILADQLYETAMLVSLGWYLMVSSHLDMSLIL